MILSKENQLSDPALVFQPVEGLWKGEPNKTRSHMNIMFDFIY